MRAAFYKSQGRAQDVFEIGEQPTPQPGPGEVRVRLKSSGVNPSDWKTRSGITGRKLTAPLIIPHSDGAGEIDAVGADVPATRMGERVWVWNGQWKRPYGTAAEYIALPSAQAVKLPDGVSFADAACFGIPALTAIQAIRLSGLQRGAFVLVMGGAGAVAHYAIQLAKLRGATVITTVSGDQKAAHAQGAGADHVINYKTEDVAARIQGITQGAGVAAVIELDLAANAKLYPSILGPHATVVVYGTAGAEATVPALWLMFNSVNVRPFLIYEVSEADRVAGIAELTKLLSEGQLKHAVARRFPLDEIAQAHDAVEQGGVIGNVVIEIG